MKQSRAPPQVRQAESKLWQTLERKKCIWIHLVCSPLVIKCSMGFSRMRSKGPRFTLGLWGLSCVRQTLRNYPQPLAWAVPMVSSAKVVTFGNSSVA